MTAMANDRTTADLRGASATALVGAMLCLLAVIALVRGDTPRAWDRSSPAQSAVSAQQMKVLVQATSAEPSLNMRAIGDRAEAINAALPFDTRPVLAVASFPSVRAGDEARRALLCLTQAVYYEAGYEPASGRRAVAQVVLNRVRHSAFPNSVCGVVYQHSRSGICQFTFVCDGALNRAPAAGAWDESRKIAAAALAGYVEASVGSATHYHANYVAPRWAPMLSKVAKIGQHIFYRWPGAWGQPPAFRSPYGGEPADPSALRARVLAVTVPIVPDGAEPIVAAPVVAGPPVARAANDVGGLLDTSKGWRLTIPDPRAAASSAQTLIAAQEGRAAHAKPATPVAVADPVPASVAAAGSDS